MVIAKTFKRGKKSIEGNEIEKIFTNKTKMCDSSKEKTERKRTENRGSAEQNRTVE